MEKIKEKILTKFKGMTFKSYIRETYDFINKNLRKTFVVLILISIILVIIGLQSAVELAKTEDYNMEDLAMNAFGKDYIDSIKIVFIIIIAGIVPYVYVPIVGIFAGAFLEITTIASLIVKVGYFRAGIVYIVPMILNICVICAATALGIYMCKTITVGYKLSSIERMNFTNFKIQLYELTNKENKKKVLDDEKNKKIKELEKKNKKLDYLQIANTTILLFILQAIASLLKVIVI